MSLSSGFSSTETANWSTAWARFFTAGYRGKRPPYYACKLLLEKEKPGIPLIVITTTVLLYIHIYLSLNNNLTD
jgi:hypothetical protein